MSESILKINSMEFFWGSRYGSKIGENRAGHKV